MGDPASGILVAAIEGTRLSEDERAFFENEKPAGLTLFRRNIAPSFPQTLDLCQEVQELLRSADGKAVIAIDQEGGRVSRIPSPFPNLGAAQTIGSESSSEDALQILQNYGFIVAKSLLGMGINVNFAPVCDVITNEANHAIGDRAFANTPQNASLRARAYLKGLELGGVKGCLKHFPGQGDAGEDTHASGTVIDQSLETLKQRELIPFQAMIRDCSMVMISHAVFPAIDDEKPASLSSKHMNGLLRNEMGFQGVVVTDDMNMKAIPQDDESWASAICEAVAMGADMVLVCQGLDRAKLALSALRHRASSDVAFAERLAEAAQRMAALRKTLA